MYGGMRCEPRRQLIDLSQMDEYPDLEQCFEDWLKLHRPFASLCDPSRVRAQAESIAVNPSSWQTSKVGEGIHFEVYRISDAAAPLSTVIKVSRPDFSGLYPNAASFERLLRKLKSIHTVSLLPPMDVFLTQQQRIAIVMPYANQPVSAAAAHWQPLERWINHSVALLAQAHMELNDVLQIRCTNGTPFIYDVSDLCDLKA